MGVSGLALPLLLLGAVLVRAADNDFLYTAVAPLRVVPNSKLFIATTVHSLNGPVNFVFTLLDEKEKTVGTGEATFKAMGKQDVEVSVGPLLDEWYNLTVKATSGAKVVEDRVLLQKEKKDRAILIQTDKPIYKPGETVKFRVFLLTKFFQPYPEFKNVIVTIYDPDRNVIKSWPKNAPFIVTGRRGFGAKEFQLSAEPNLGTWTIEVEDIEGVADRSSLQFSVDEYVLPKFKVGLTFTPSFVTYNDSKFTVAVEVTTTFGKPLDSTCTVTLKEPYAYYMREGRIPSVTRTTHAEKGVVNIEFDVKNELKIHTDEINKWGKGFTVFASCKDTASGAVRNETSTITMYQFPYKIEMIDRPSSIRPGFPLNITLKVSTQDGSPIGDEREDALKIEHGFDYTEEGGVMHSSIPANGIVVIPFVAPTNPKICFEALDVTYKLLKDNFWLPSKTVSPTKSYMQLQLLTPTKEVREEVPIRINVKTSRPMRSISALTLSRGTVRRSELVEIEMKSNQRGLTDNDITLLLPPKSSPSTNVLIYTTFDNGDLIADSIKLDVNPDKSNEVVVTVSDPTVEPGHNVSISLKGHNKSGQVSYFGVRAVDQSVLLLKKDNDLNLEKLGNVANSFRPRGIYWGGSEIFQKFSENGLLLMTNANVDKGHAQNIHPLPPAAPMFSKISADYAESADEESEQDMMPLNLNLGFAGASANRFPTRGGAASAMGGGGAEPPRVRSNFPETWIWEDMESKDGEVTLHKTVPDTITSWFISAFQMDSKFGLGLSTNTPKVTVFRPFFIVLNLPYSVVKGEVLALQVLVHNYMDTETTATVTLDNEDGWFKFIEEEDAMTKTVSVNASSIVSVTFPISPLKHGIMTLKAKATTAEAGDAIKRTLIVKPPGIKHTQNSAVLVNLLSSPTFSAKGLTAVFPETRVPDADSLKVSVVGDILGGTMKNLDKLIRLPQGCGEQNMVNFVPDVVIMDYLNKTGGLTEEIRRKATGYLEKGYQRQLTYLRHDGSYSAFGKSDLVGSTWLTAFVTRSFIQAKRHIYIDDEVIKRSLRFLVRQQNDNGSFAEEGFVYDTSLQGGAGASNQVPLTAFALLTFAEAEKNGFEMKKISNETIGLMNKGIDFIKKHSKENNKDPYTANLVSYLFHVMDHPSKDEAFKVTQDLARKHDDGTTHWEQISKQPIPRNESIVAPWRIWEIRNRVKPATVEITSYGLLTYLLRGNIDDSVAISKWLLKRRNAEGGFISTQDTVVGITALAKFAESLVAKSGDGNTNVKLMWKGGSHDFQVNPTNRITLQEYILPQNTREIDIEGEGKGTALAQLTWSYYVEEADAEPAFTLTTVVTDKDKGRSLDMKICATYTRGEKSNMAIVEANTPSGYAFDQEQLEELRQANTFKRYELENKDSHLNLYFEGLAKQQAKCVTLKAYRLHLVAKHQPGEVKVYDYYDVTQKASVLYPVPAISLCDICKTEPTCDLKECKEE